MIFDQHSRDGAIGGKLVKRRQDLSVLFLVTLCDAPSQNKAFDFLKPPWIG